MVRVHVQKRVWKIISRNIGISPESKFWWVRVRVSRTLGDRVTGVAPYVLNLFLPVAYTSSDSKVYGSFRFFKQIVLHT